VRHSGAVLCRALTAAGVPVIAPPSGVPVAEQPASRAMLAVLASVAEGLDADRALQLLTGPIGRLDPVSLRQLRRALRRADRSQPRRDFGELLIEALESTKLGVTGDLAGPLRRVRAVLAAARRSEADGEDPRYTLWQAWHRSSLQKRWLAGSERGGTVGAKADADLEAVTALFDVTEQYVSRTAGASLRGLVEHVNALGPVTTAGQPRDIDGVTLVSAHAALGGEWDVVIIAGLQEGLWPNTTPRGGVLGTQYLVDVLEGVTDGTTATGVSSRAPLLAEERRLLIAAMGRARSRLLVTAVDSECGDESMLPSPFYFELAKFATDTESDTAEPVLAPRVLAPSPLVGRLRAVVCASEGAVADTVRACAAAQLARLAAAGVSGADPKQWYGMTAPSSDEPLWSGDDHVVRLSPSTLQTLADCPLRWLLERHGGSDGRDVRSAIGSLVHALVADPGMSESRMVAELERVWENLPIESAWYADNELARHRTMVSTFAQWRDQTRRELTEVGTEVAVDGVLDCDGTAVRVCGRLDRLERDELGRLTVVDIKTGKTPVSKDAAQRHAQLAMYQLAIAEGLLAEGDSPGGGRLVYLGRAGSAGPTERQQDPLTPDVRGRWLEQVQKAAEATKGPQFVARVNDGCAHCPVKQSCPAQAADRTATS
jgi:RecB family exonuclease